MNTAISIATLSRLAELINRCGALLLCAVLLESPLHAKESPANWLQRFNEAAQQYQSGEFNRAIASWRDIAKETSHSDALLSARAYLGVAAACQKIGLYQEAQQALSDALPATKKAGDLVLVAQYDQQAGNLSLAMHRHSESLEQLSQAASKAEKAQRSELLAAILNDYGNALNISGYASDALVAYRKALAPARELGLNQLALSAEINIARLQLERKEIAAARETVQDAAVFLNGMMPSYDWAMSLLALADVEQDVGQGAGQSTGQSTGLPGVKPDDVKLRNDYFESARVFAESAHNMRLLSLIYSYQGKGQLALGDLVAAEALLRKAIFYSAQEQAPDVLYQAYWQLARLERSKGNLDAAINAFDRALTTLAPIREELSNGYHNSHQFFQQRVRPVYAEFVDVLLTSADRSSATDAQRAMLERARNVMEVMKSAELQDYFRDECVTAPDRKAVVLNQIAKNVAVLYPIVLPDRVELLLSVNGELKKRNVAIDQGQLAENALRLRELIQDPSHTRFLPYATRLYRWLIEPIKAQLVAEGIDTLVVIPDGVLRTVPFAALYSGDHYLIEEFSLAVTPALKLTNASQMQSSESTALLAGISQSVQGFGPLPKVTSELSSIHDQSGGRVLANRDYTKTNLRAALAAADYNVVHLATHGTVGTTPADSFLLTYDGKLTMGDLDSLMRIGGARHRSLDLLTLSACETAVGDEQAALGLAGLAVKSGATSVVASLWLVDDTATAALMDQFYRHMFARADSRLTKARALRAAQMRLLSEPATAHPANWAAFVMIGNWQ